MAGYVVTAGYVTVETAVPGGRAAVDIPRGAELPDDVPDEQRAALLTQGHIEPARAEPEPIPAPPTGPPPRGGPGSGADAWAAYAHAHGVPVPDGANRDQIRALLDEHGVPTE
ncbi:hypothetical protein ABGB07_02295 [Micromonosporaceae bacterium B7E4]